MFLFQIWILSITDSGLSRGRVLVSMPASIGSAVIHRGFQPWAQWPMLAYALDDRTGGVRVRASGWTVRSGWSMHTCDLRARGCASGKQCRADCSLGGQQRIEGGRLSGLIALVPPLPDKGGGGPAEFG